MKPLWNVRLYQKGDEVGIVNLMNLVFPNASYDIKRWLWEYLGNPLGYLAAVADYSGQIVGHMGLVPARMKIGQRLVTGAQAVDLAVHPKFRRQGMFVEIGKTLMKKATEQEIPISYGFSSQLAYRGHVKYGWFKVCLVPVKIKFLNRNAVLKFIATGFYSFIQRAQRDFLGFLTYMAELCVKFFFFTEGKQSHKALAPEELWIHAASSFDNRIDDLWNKVSMKYEIVVARNKQFLNWRYFRKPGTNYAVFVAEKDANVKGYVVLAVKSPKYQKVGYIVDIFADSEDTIRHLIYTAIKYFSHSKVDFIESWMMKVSPYYEVLQENGFEDKYLSEKLILIVRINSNHFLERYEAVQANWYVAMGDSDGI